MNALDTPICRLYAIRLGDQRLVHYEPMDVVYLIELGIVQPDTYIYCYSFRKWKKAIELKDIRENLSSEAKTRPDLPHNEIPKFVPPPPPMSPYYSLQDLIRDGYTSEVDPEEIKKLNREIEYRNQEIIQKESEVQVLQSELKIWQDNYHKVKADSGFKPQNIQAYEAEIETLEKSLSDVSIELDDRKAKVSQLKERLKVASVENKKLAKALMAISKEHKRTKEYAKDLEAQLEGALRGRESLKKNLKQKEGDLLRLQKREIQAKKLIKRLGKEKESQEVKKELEFNRLIGESYEVENSPKWMVKRDGEVKGPYRFSDVLDWYKKNLIDRQTNVKKESEQVYTRIENIYEFNTKVFTKVESEGKTTTKKFYVKRTDFRAPFYETVRVSFRDETFTGQCTSLSIGGCFIEFGQRLPEPVKLNTVLECFIHAEYLSHPIEVQMIVRNVKAKKPFGVGCEFLDLEDAEKDAIEEFVDSYLHTSHKKSA